MKDRQLSLGKVTFSLFFEIVSRNQIMSQMNDLKEVIETKDATIEELQSRLAHPSLRPIIDPPHPHPDPNAVQDENVAILSHAIREREDKIEDLQQKLEEASRYVSKFCLSVCLSIYLVMPSSVSSLSYEIHLNHRLLFD